MTTSPDRLNAHMTAKPTVLVTGVSGSLGLRLVEELDGFEVIGADVREPAKSLRNLRFVKVDLREERSCDQLLELMRAHRPQAVAHLAFVMSPARAGLRDRKAMWYVNVVGTSRVSEAVAEYNRMVGGIEKFIFTSSAAVYGPSPRGAITEDTLLKAHELPYALQQQEADITVQSRATGLRQCQTFILRSHSYAGAGAWNYELHALRGAPDDRTFLGKRWQRRNTRLPLFLPSRGGHLEHRTQYVHFADIARLVAHIVRRVENGPALTVMNVAGRGEAVSLRRRIEIAEAPIKFLPAEALCRQAQRMLFTLGISDIPPAALPYLSGSAIMDTARLRTYLGEHYRSVIQHTCEDALKESFSSSRTTEQTHRLATANA